MSLTMRILGLIVVALFVATGLAVAPEVLPLLACLGLLGAFGVLCLREEEPWVARTALGRSPIRLAVGAAVGTVAVIYTAVGMTVLLGGVATTLAAATALAWLGYRRMRRRAAREAEHAAPGGPGPAEIGAADVGCADVASTDPGFTDAGSTDAGARGLMPADPAGLSTEDLCRAWRVSYLLLEKARVPGELAHVAELRRRYLDELARRHPEGFRRWLDDGARAAGDPSRYLRGRSAPSERDDDQAA